MLGLYAAATWLHRLPHQAWALVVCALALLLGVAVADDYGVWHDSYQQRAIGEATLRHLAGENGLNLLSPPSDRLYGPVFEAPLALVERVLGDDGRRIYLSRHLLTHLFFLIAGFAGYLLAYRLFGSRWLALFALLLFLLHPRIYAHSFFNSKDVPFLSLFMICLWLAHRAFGKEAGKETGRGRGKGKEKETGTASAFALCGVAAGLLTNLRVAGLAFVAVVLFMRLCDVLVARDGDERRRIIVSGALFALASVVAYYATMPYLWADPVVRFKEILAVMSSHPTATSQLFQGELVNGSALPPSYVPVWFGITSPPLALLLGAFGLVALVWRGATARESLLRNTPLRFELLVAACFVLQVLAAVALRPTLHSDWRHFYFLWGPFALLAASGLRALVEVMRRRLPATRAPTVIAAGLTTAGLGAMAVEMARLHPHQNLYFNALARPGAAVPLRQRFHLDDTFSRTHGYAYILQELGDRQEVRNPVFNVWLSTSARRRRQMARLDLAISPAYSELLNQRDQRRLTFDRNADPDFYVRDWHAIGRTKGRHAIGRPGARFPPVLYERKFWDEVIVQVATPDLSRVDEATARTYRTRYRELRTRAPAISGDIDVYRDEAAVAWVKESCPAGDLNHTMDMIVIPLEVDRARYMLRADGVRVGGACLWQVPLPDHAIAKIVFPRLGSLASNAYLEERRRRYAMLTMTPPAARSTFNVYLQDGTLSYLKSPCAEADTKAYFFVHVRPDHLADLPRARRPSGFATLDFRFGGADPRWHYAAGDLFDGVCMATLNLPDYPVTSVATGQYAPDGTGLWRVDVGGGRL